MGNDELEDVHRTDIFVAFLLGQSSFLPVVRLDGDVGARLAETHCNRTVRLDITRPPANDAQNTVSQRFMCGWSVDDAE